jgi:hypothetical protein
MTTKSRNKHRRHSHKREQFEIQRLLSEYKEPDSLYAESVSMAYDCLVCDKPFHLDTTRHLLLELARVRRALELAEIRLRMAKDSMQNVEGRDAANGDS